MGLGVRILRRAGSLEKQRWAYAIQKQRPHSGAFLPGVRFEKFTAVELIRWSSQSHLARFQSSFQNR
jgi:hypothetical protein